MGDVDERAECAKFRAVCWGDAGEVRRWLQALREQVNDLAAAARDQTRKKEERVLSRYEAGRQTRRASRKLNRLLAAGEAGLGPQSPLDPAPRLPDEPEEDEEDDAPSSSQRRVEPLHRSEAG